MYTAYMSAHVWRMLRPIDAVGTIVPRRLTALDPPVILKIMLHAEYAVAIAAGKRSRVFVARRGDDVLVRDRPIIVFPPRAHRLGGCKRKHRTSSSSIDPVTIVAKSLPRLSYPFSVAGRKRTKENERMEEHERTVFSGAIRLAKQTLIFLLDHESYHY